MAFAPPSAWDPDFALAHPAFAPLRPHAARFATRRDWPPVDAWNDALADLALASASGAPLRFVTQPPRRRRRAVDLAELYDARIDARGEVPSRARSWHDFLNMLCWATYPRAKAALSARQHAALARWVAPGARRLPSARTREQDVLAMLDEGGALLLCAARDEALVGALVERGDAVALTNIVREGRVRALLFGHAAYEHLVAGDAAMRAMAVVLATGAVPAGDDAVAAADALLAARLADEAFLREPPGAPGLLLAEGLFG